MNRFEAIVARLNGDYEFEEKIKKYIDNSYLQALYEQHNLISEKFFIPDVMLLQPGIYHQYVPLQFSSVYRINDVSL